MKSSIYLDSNSATLTFMHTPHISWTSNSGRRSCLQLMFTNSNPEPNNAISQMMLPLLGLL